jgi:tRNA-dihydrouridine synthase
VYKHTKINMGDRLNYPAKVVKKSYLWRRLPRVAGGTRTRYDTTMMTRAIYLAPVQGVTDRTFRDLHEKRFGGVDAYYTPFARVERGGVRARDARDVDPALNGVTRLVPQVIAGEPGEFRLLLETLAGMGYRRVDLNAGCPFPMLARRGKGAALPRQPERLEALLAVMQEFPGVSLSVKARLGWDDPSECTRLLLPVLERAPVPVHSVVLHARLATGGYAGEVDLAAFGAFHDRCPFPLVYNGGVRSVGDYRAIVERFPRLEGVMIGQGLLADPSLALACRGEALPDGERLSRLKAFHDELLEAYAARLQGDDQLLSRMRAFWEYFLPGAPRRPLKRLRKTTKLARYREAVEACFNDNTSER